jgi:PucR family transcriptional regulator, purine catabolism regulatory protein
LFRIAIGHGRLAVVARPLRKLSDTPMTPPLGRRLRVGDVLAFPAFEGARVLAGAAGLRRSLVRASVMRVPAVEHARRGELILAAGSAFDELRDPPDRLIRALGERGVAALAAHGPSLGKLGEAGVRAAETLSLPLVELPPGAPLDLLLTELLETLVASQAAHLRMASGARDDLIDVVLSGGGLPQLAATMAELAQGPIAIIGASGAALAVSDRCDRSAAERVAAPWFEEEWTAPADAGDGWILWPILAAGSRMGCVAARLPVPDDPLILAAVQGAATSAAFEILHELEEAAAVTRLTEQFVRDLLIGTLDPIAASQRATAVGWDLGAGYRMLLARPADGAPGGTVEAARRLAPDARVMLHDGDCLALVAAGARAPAGDDDPATALARALAGELAAVRVGVSRTHTEIGELPLVHAEAAEALRCAETFDKHTPYREFDPHSPLRMLTHVPVEELRAFEREALAPLDALDPEQRQGLTATLALLVHTGLNVAETARQGGWHYNTVRYRVLRLTELLGPFMEVGSRLDSLTLALLLRRELPR